MINWLNFFSKGYSYGSLYCPDLSFMLRCEIHFMGVSRKSMLNNAFSS